ncbi:hypothetical protein AeMF1_007677 [Aphanomyces euteiches]|nr:hypothetical protein AeMF1_021391 [Aphanomyces euteiches]KAH9111317.1 hypothetical protein AeMF1_014136 [Aphanomyces euteiches]KAH9119885.1 hypothetical protein AeMF1_007677 [Aphanomyces euteiches]KAH9183085.1 hypothetical protein AeNC1_014939 [Aphanomyces euteiches]
MVATSPVVPVNLVFKIAFFLEDWETLHTFIVAVLRSKALGPLKHIWHLYADLRWNHAFLWPRLRLTRITMDPASLEHLQGIARYYSKIIVDETTDVNWVRQHVHPLASIAWIRPTKKLDAKSLQAWKSFRITSLEKIDNTPRSCLQAFPILERIQVVDITREIAEDVLKYAAFSNTVRSLDLRTSFSEIVAPCVITTKMANWLFRWFAYHPIRSFKLHKFAWKNQAVRAQILSNILAKPTIEIFQVAESFDNVILLVSDYARRFNRLKLSFSSLKYHREDVKWDTDKLKDSLYIFRGILETKCTKFIFEHEYVHSENEPLCAWPFVAKMVQMSKLQTFHLKRRKLALEDAILLADAIRDHETLCRLDLTGAITSLEDAKMIISAAPKSLTTISITKFNDLSDAGWKELDLLATDRSITLKQTPPPDEE